MKRVLTITALVFLAACSSGHSKATPATTTTGSSAPDTSTTTPETSSSTTATTGSPTTHGTGTPATTVPGGSGGSTSGSSNNSSVQIKSFTFVGNSPVECNAPSTIEMKWTTTGATAVEMDIDGGGAFTHYANGTHDEMLPLPCDGNSHTYKLVATAPGVSVDHSITIETEKI